MALIAHYLRFAKPRHALIIQGHIVFQQRVIPMIIEQNPFAVWWIGGHGFGNQVRPSGEFGLNMRHHFFAVTIINPVHGALRMRPIGILFQEWQQAVRITPEHGEAKPSGIERYILEQILCAV